MHSKDHAVGRVVDPHVRLLAPRHPAHASSRRAGQGRARQGRAGQGSSNTQQQGSEDTSDVGGGGHHSVRLGVRRPVPWPTAQGPEQAVCSVQTKRGASSPHPHSPTARLQLRGCALPGRRGGEGARQPLPGLGAHRHPQRLHLQLGSIGTAWRGAGGCVGGG